MNTVLEKRLNHFCFLFLTAFTLFLILSPFFFHTDTSTYTYLHRHMQTFQYIFLPPFSNVRYSICRLLIHIFFYIFSFFQHYSILYFHFSLTFNLGFALSSFLFSDLIILTFFSFSFVPHFSVSFLYSSFSHLFL